MGEMEKRIESLFKKIKVLEVDLDFDPIEISLSNYIGLSEILGVRITYNPDSLNYVPLQFWNAHSDTIKKLLSKYPIEPLDKDVRI